MAEQANELPIVRLVYDAGDLKALQRMIATLAKQGKKELSGLTDEVDKQLEFWEKQLKVQKEASKEAAFQKKLRQEAHRLRRQYGVDPPAKKRAMREEFRTTKQVHEMETRQLRKIARLTDPRERIKAGMRGGKLTAMEERVARGARGELRRRATARAAKMAGGGAAKAVSGIAAGFQMLNKTMGTIGLVLDIIQKSPLWKILMKLLDFDGLFRFNKELHAAAGGIDMLRASLRDGAGAFAAIEEEIWDNAAALNDMTTNMRFMVKADERLAALRGFETAGVKMNEFISTLGQGTQDVTVQAIALGRVVGMEGQEVATYMGEFIRNMGVSVSDIGATFANIITDASEAGISQRFFIDQIRNATSALGMYEFNLSGVSKLLRDMTKNSIQPAEVAMRDFNTLLGAGRAMNLGQIGASFQVAMQDAGFQRGITALTNMLGARLDPGVFGGEVAGSIAEMNRQEFNQFLKELTATKNLNIDQQRELRSVYDALSAMDAAQRGDFFELRNALQTGALGPDFVALMVNAVAQQQFQGKKLADLTSHELDVLSQFLGIGQEQLLTLRDTVPSNEEIIENLNSQVKEQENASENLKNAIAVSQAIKEAIVNPDKAFEIVMEHLVRIIQQMVVKLVQLLLPYAIDILSNIMRLIAGMTQGLIMMAENFIDTYDVGREIFNLASALGGGPTITGADVAAAGLERRDWDDLVDDVSKLRAGVSVGGARGTTARGIIAREEATPSVADQLQRAMVTAYSETAAGDWQRATTLLEERQGQMAQLENNLVEAQKSGDEKQAQQMAEQIEMLRNLINASRQALTGAWNDMLGAARAAEGGGWEAGFASARAAGAQRTIDEVSEALESYGKVEKRQALSPVESVQRMAGYATGGIAVRPQIAAIAEREPEIQLPMSRVPEVMSEVMARSGAPAGGGISIGEMHFHLPETAAQNQTAFAQAVRRVFLEEMRVVMAGRRAV